MAQHPQQRRPVGGGEAGQAVDAGFAALLGGVDLGAPGADLFDTVAEKIAKQLREERSNKTAQVRRFYDEMLRFRAEARTDEAVQKLLPYIRMLNAKAAYSHQRELVDKSFLAFLRTMLGQVKDRQTLKNACLLFEAVIGFSPRT